MPVDENNWNYYDYPNRVEIYYGSSSECDEEPPMYEEDRDFPVWDPSVVDSEDAYETITISNENEDEVIVLKPRMSATQAQTDGIHDFEKAVKLYGNPLAVDEQWSVTKEDFNLIRLPKIGVGLTMKISFRTVSDPSKHDRPGFIRDPHNNPWFDPEMEFESVRIPNKLRNSRFVGTGFRRVYDGDVFARHDVSPADWQGFLYDITAAGTSAMGTIPLGRNLVKTGLPFTDWAGDLMQLCHENSARKVVDIWQQKFFAPRGLSVGIEKHQRPSYTQIGYSEDYNVRKTQKLAKREQKIFAKDYGRTRLVVSKLK